MAKRSSKAQKNTVRSKHPSSSKATKTASRPATRSSAARSSASQPKKSPKSSTKTVKPAIKAGKPAAPKAAARRPAEVRTGSVKTATAAARKGEPIDAETRATKSPPSAEPPSQGSLAKTPSLPEPKAPAEAPPVASRAPTRKVFGPDNKVITLGERRQLPATPPPADTPQIQDLSEISLGAPIKREVDLPSLHELFPTKGSGAATKRAVDLQAVPSFPTVAPSPAPNKHSVAASVAAEAAPGVARVSWSNLPASLDKDLKSELGVIASHCASAASSPFPFAKLLAAIPQELCALQFAALLLDTSSEDAPEVKAKKLGITSAQLASLLSDGSAALSELFASYCASMYRSWKAQLVGRVVSAQSLVEHHLIHSIDKDFQLLISRVILCSFGVKP